MAFHSACLVAIILVAPIAMPAVEVKQALRDNKHAAIETARCAISGFCVGAAAGSFAAPGPGTAVGAAIGTVAGGWVGYKTGKNLDWAIRKPLDLDAEAIVALNSRITPQAKRVLNWIDQKASTWNGEVHVSPAYAFGDDRQHCWKCVYDISMWGEDYRVEMDIVFLKESLGDGKIRLAFNDVRMVAWYRLLDGAPYIEMNTNISSIADNQAFMPVSDQNRRLCIEAASARAFLHIVNDPVFLVEAKASRK